MKNSDVYHERTPKSLGVFRKLKQLTIGVILMFNVINVEAQDSRFNISFENATIETIFDELRNQSDVNFIFNHEELSKCAPVKISLSNATLKEVLLEILKDTGLTYEVVNNTIVITPIKSKANKSSRSILKQTVRGNVIDTDSKLPLIGVAVVISGSSPLIGTITDIDGNFRLKNVETGRVTLNLSYLGYEAISIPNAIVNSGKEVVLNLEMQESIVKMEEIIVTANENSGEAINDMSLISARSISAEETSRYAGGFSDPSRILASFAGVTNSQNAENDIIVRGNSPKYIQWRLEGLEISNPSHFGDQNGIKGGISALNNNLLSTSDFYSGAFSPEYGDALSGIYDIKLRAGNNEKFESAIGFGLLGTDLTLEGPFKKGYGGSYLVNYRYSTVALPNDLGLVNLDGVLSYQDVTFKIVLPTKRAGVFSFFGLGGMSGFEQNEFDPDGQPIPNSSIIENNVGKDYDKSNYLLNSGMNHMLTLNKSSFINTSLSYSTSGNSEDVFKIRTTKLYDDNGEFIADSVGNEILDYKNRLVKSTYRGAITYNNKFNSKSKIQIGTKYSLFGYDYKQGQLQNNEAEFFTLIDFKENISTVRNFISWKYRINDNITLVSGLHNMNVLYNNKSTLEPRVAVNWDLSSTSSLHAGYGKHSNMESVHNYFAKVEQEDGSITEPNKDLDLLKAHHYVIGYEKRFSEKLMAKIEIYYQQLYNLPVENNDTSFYSTINEGTDFRYVDLVNKGTGTNYGIELTLEKFLSNNYYFLINTSLFSSKYKSLENVERNTQYNGNYILNILAGKEFEELGKKQNQTLSLNAKVFFGGGRKIITLLRDEEGNVAVDPVNDKYWDYENAYENKIDDIFQLNISTSYKWNRPKATHELFLDLVNVTNNSGRISEFYDESEENSVGYIKQFFFFPNLMYRVYF